MSTRSALHGAGCSATGDERRRPPLSLAPASLDRLRRCSDRLDRLQQQVSVGARSQREHDELVEEAEAIAAELRAVFRAPTPAMPVNPPLWQQGGKAAW
jgi:hypothetical protein